MSSITSLVPTRDEIRNWIRHVVQHVSHVEYYLAALHIGEEDPERPHDMVGLGNKFEWLVMKGLSIACRRPPEDVEFFNTHVLPSIEIHRQQHHHVQRSRPIIERSEDTMWLAAIDAVCSRLEDRPHQGGKHTFGQIFQLALTETSNISSRIQDVIPKMSQLERPDIEAITRLDTIPNIGLPGKIHAAIVRRVNETLHMLRTEQGIDIQF